MLVKLCEGGNVIKRLIVRRNPFVAESACGRLKSLHLLLYAIYCE
jgi:hypothetical protein